MEVIIVSTSQVCYEDLMCCWRGFCCSQLIKSILTMVERKGAFNQNAFKMVASAIWQIWRDGGLSVPQKPPLKFLLNLETLKGNKEEILDIRWDRGSQLSPSPTVCRLCASLLTRDLPLAVILFTRFGHTVCLGDYWREHYGRDLVIC